MFAASDLFCEMVVFFEAVVGVVTAVGHSLEAQGMSLDVMASVHAYHLLVYD